MILSLIVTIYNAENFIIECLSSITCQIHGANVEVVLVNDGSTDNSLNLIDEFLQAQPNEIREKFIIIIQKNKGVSEARNKGITVSNGEYISFLDSDDILEENFFNTILTCIRDFKPDIIQFGAYKFISRTEKKFFLQKNARQGFFEANDEIVKDIFIKSEWFICFRVYNRELFFDTKFPIGRNYEDLFLIPELTLNSRTFFFINNELMGYRINPFSITNDLSKKNIDDLKWVNMEIYKRVFVNNLYIYPFLNSLIFLMYSIFTKERFYVFLVEYFRIMRRYSKIKIFKVSIKKKITIKNIFFIIFPILYIVMLYYKNKEKVI